MRDGATPLSSSLVVQVENGDHLEILISPEMPQVEVWGNESYVLEMGGFLYNSGDDITDLKDKVGQYLSVYEVDSDNIIMSVDTIKLTEDMIKKEEVPVEEPEVPTEDPVVEEPEIPVEEPEVPTEDPVVEEPEIPVEEPEIPVEEPEIPVEEPEEPVEEPEIPVEEPEIPVEEPEEPVEEPEVPTEDPEIPIEDPVVEEPEIPVEEPEVPTEDPVVEEPVEDPEIPIEEPEVPTEDPEIPIEDPVVEEPVEDPEIPIEEPVVEEPVEEPEVPTEDPVVEEPVEEPEVPTEDPEIPIEEPIETETPGGGSSDTDGEEDSINNGIVEGTIVDMSGNPLEGIEVTLHSIVRKTTTDKYGRFRFTNVELGPHTLIINESNRVTYSEIKLDLMSNGDVVWTSEESRIGFELDDNFVDINCLIKIRPIVEVPNTEEGKDKSGNDTGSKGTTGEVGIIGEDSDNGFEYVIKDPIKRDLITKNPIMKELIKNPSLIATSTPSSSINDNITGSDSSNDASSNEQFIVSQSYENEDTSSKYLDGNSSVSDSSNDNNNEDNIDTSVDDASEENSSNDSPNRSPREIDFRGVGFSFLWLLLILLGWYLKRCRDCKRQGKEK